MEAAGRVFAAKGFEAAQTPEIAAEAGVSTGAFYRYFSDKRHVFVEMIGDHLQRSHEEVMAKLSPERFRGAGVIGAIEGAIQVVFEAIARAPGLDRVYLAMSLTD